MVGLLKGLLKGELLCFSSTVFEEGEITKKLIWLRIPGTFVDKKNYPMTKEMETCEEIPVLGPVKELHKNLPAGEGREV